MSLTDQPVDKIKEFPPLARALHQTHNRGDSSSSAGHAMGWQRISLAVAVLYGVSVGTAPILQCVCIRAPLICSTIANVEGEEECCCRDLTHPEGDCQEDLLSCCVKGHCSEDLSDFVLQGSLPAPKDLFGGISGGLLLVPDLWGVKSGSYVLHNRTERARQRAPALSLLCEFRC